MLIAALMTGVGVGSWMTGALQARLPLDTLYRLSSLYPLLVLALAWLGSKSLSKHKEARQLPLRLAVPNPSGGLDTFSNAMQYFRIMVCRS